MRLIASGESVSKQHDRLWDCWVSGEEADDPFFRPAVSNCIFGQDLPYIAANEKQKEALETFLPFDYAYTQLLFRHAIFPSQTKGNGKQLPSLLAVRRVKVEVCEDVMEISYKVGDVIRAKESVIHNLEWVLESESWAFISPVPEPGVFGESAIYGHVPVYSILASVLTNGFCSTEYYDSQRELIIVPLSDVEVIAEKDFNEENYMKEIMFPAMEKQYGVSHRAILGARKLLKNVGVDA